MTDHEDEANDLDASRRADDPETSQGPSPTRAQHLNQRIVTSLDNLGPGLSAFASATSEGIALAIRERYNSISPRMINLELDGRVRRVGEGITTARRPAVLWASTKHFPLTEDELQDLAEENEERKWHSKEEEMVTFPIISLCKANGLEVVYERAVSHSEFGTGHPDLRIHFTPDQPDLFAFWECKRPGKEPTRLQTKALAHLSKLYGVHRVGWGTSLEDFVRWARHIDPDRALVIPEALVASQ